LFFLDSKTINTSVAAKTAAQHNIAHASRDVFLDHEDTPQYVAKALKRVENIARQTGSVIAIGHPKANTMNALKDWIPQAKARGFEFVAVSRLMTQPAPRHHRVKKAQVQKVGNKENKEKVIVVNVEPTTPKPRKVALPLISYPVD
jgi:polysaccharide deacetylase 2 family uncharacterized protein YibQ